MAVWGDLAALTIYALQQLGVVLAVGAETLLLVYYLASAGKELHPSHPHARFAQYAGLALIITSGIGALALLFIEPQQSVLTAPAFVFKWILIVALLVCAVVQPEIRLRGWVAYIAAGIEGAAWYALFVVHVVAPVTTWEYLLLAYAGWTIIFTVMWSGFVYTLLPKKIKEKAPQKIPVEGEINMTPTPSPRTFAEPKPAPVPISKKSEPKAESIKVESPKPAPMLPVVALVELEAPHPMPAPAPVHHMPASAPKKPMAAAAPTPHYPAPAPKPVAVAEAPKEDGLPSIRVMPRTPEELIKNFNHA